MSEQQAPPSLPPTAPVDPDRPRAPLRWWIEILLTLVFYAVYSAIRNQFGSALGQSIKDDAFDNARRVIDLEKAIGLYHEEWIHNRFIDWDAFIVFWNVFYGSLHFIVTIGTMVFLFLRHLLPCFVDRNVRVSRVHAVVPLRIPRHWTILLDYFEKLDEGQI